MHVLVERRYIFRRKSNRARVAFAVMASAVAMTAWTATVADAKPGGYHRGGAAEAPVVAELG